MPYPKDPNIVYGSCKGQYGVMNLKTGQERIIGLARSRCYGNPATDLICGFSGSRHGDFAERS